MPALDPDDLDPASLDPADLDPADLDLADLDPAELGSDFDPADLDSHLVSDTGPLGVDDLEANPADVVEQRLDVPADDDEA